MSEVWDATYQAVRSRITNADIGTAVEQAMVNVAGDANRAFQQIPEQFYDYSRPSVIWRPTLTKDGDAWIACYGPNLQEGVVGCGETPAKAMADFDIKWNKN